MAVALLQATAVAKEGQGCVLCRPTVSLSFRDVCKGLRSNGWHQRLDVGC